RANGSRSVGPKTAAGKRRSALNATLHGLRAAAPVVPGEDPNEWERHRAAVSASLSPSGALEEELAQRVALLLWRLRRVAAHESTVVAARLREATAGPPATPSTSRQEIASAGAKAAEAEATRELLA